MRNSAQRIYGAARENRGNFRTMSIYEKVIVIGYGKITGQIVRYLQGRRTEHGFLAEYIEHEAEPFGITRGICRDLGITCMQIKDKKRLTDYFSKIPCRTLIVSASNNYLFPAVITDNPQYTIVNFHNALLPKFPGRNAPSWAIFENEPETGITWHYVTGEVDAGDIIIQKKCAITADVRAYELAEKLMRLAFEAFTEKFDEIIENRVRAGKQQLPEERKIYKSSELPGMCRFSMEDPPEYIYRLLRAADFGKAGIFPQVTTTYQGKCIKILRYSRILAREAEEKPGRLYLPLDAESSLRLSYNTC